MHVKKCFGNKHNWALKPDSSAPRMGGIKQGTKSNLTDTYKRTTNNEEKHRHKNIPLYHLDNKIYIKQNFVKESHSEVPQLSLIIRGKGNATMCHSKKIWSEHRVVFSKHSFILNSTDNERDQIKCKMPQRSNKFSKDLVQWIHKKIRKLMSTKYWCSIGKWNVQRKPV